jgi:large subunit ribosomal protein L22
MEERLMIAKASHKYLKTSSQKARLVVDQIKGKEVNEALSILKFSRKLVAKDVEKVLRSAVANAQQGEAKIDLDNLYISNIFVNPGPMEKRVRNRAMGRIYRILKRSCHLTIHLDEREKSKEGT